MLSEKDKIRYGRHLVLSEIGIKGQEKLKHAKVIVVGAGGLGCPVLMYLTAAGVGKIGIIDFETIEESNLQRQLLYAVNDVGRYKAETARQKLSLQNPLIEVESINSKLTTQNAIDIFSGYDIVIDGTDNFSTRYLVNDACMLLRKTLVSGSIYKFQGQVSVFNFKEGPTYRCLFPSPPGANAAPSCSEIGVLGVLPGIIGTVMANEVIKVIVGIGEVLSGKMLLVDSLDMRFQTIEIERNSEAVNSAPKNAEEFKGMDYDHFCGVPSSAIAVKEVTADELRSMISLSKNMQLVDVRESDELPDIQEFTDINIPLGQIEDQVTRISRNKKVIVICRSGNRSRKAIELLSGKFGYDNLYNLKGGVTEWMKSVSKKQTA
jgi:adenylyltransferase/sulfurtransferase